MQVRLRSISQLDTPGVGYGIGLDTDGHRVELTLPWAEFGSLQSRLDSGERVTVEVEEWQIVAIDDELRVSLTPEAMAIRAAVLRDARPEGTAQTVPRTDSSCSQCGATLYAPWWDEERGGYLCRQCGTLNERPKEPASAGGVARTIGLVVAVVVLLWVLFAVVAVVGWALVSLNEPTPTPLPAACSEPASGPSAAHGRIAFTSYRFGNSDVYVINADGTGLTRLTDDAEDEFRPSWSPDGVKVAFASRRNYDIYVMNADGTGVKQLTDHPDVETSPAWSPDGAKIAFVSYRGGAWEIYVMNADGTGVRQLTDDPDVELDEPDPAWSPDGTMIAFRGNRGIYVMNADGTGLRRLTEEATIGGGGEPDWSPDGTLIAFHHTGAFGSDYRANFDIYVMNADGTGVRRLTRDAGDNLSPTWSPDGDFIAFVSTRCGRDEIYVMNADGSGVSRLTDDAADPAWSPANGASQ